MKHTALFTLAALLLTPLARLAAGAGENILPPGWDAKQAADKVMAGLTNISGPQVKGAHDSDFVIINDRVYMVSIANNVQPGENPEWPFCYAAMSVVDLPTRKLEKFIPFAKSEQAFANATLPPTPCAAMTRSRAC